VLPSACQPRQSGRTYLAPAVWAWSLRGVAETVSASFKRPATAPGLQAVISALRAKGAVSAVDHPADGPVVAALRAAGARVTLRQYETVKLLD
jgi:hypothetical protein